MEGGGVCLDAHAMELFEEVLEGEVPQRVLGSSHAIVTVPEDAHGRRRRTAHWQLVSSLNYASFLLFMGTFTRFSRS